MPARARKETIRRDEVGYYHCFNRCVRRAFLCGVDPLTGNDYGHRKTWIQQRLETLAACFADRGLRLLGHGQPSPPHPPQPSRSRRHVVGRRGGSPLVAVVSPAADAAGRAGRASGRRAQDLAERSRQDAATARPAVRRSALGLDGSPVAERQTGRDPRRFASDSRAAQNRCFTLAHARERVLTPVPLGGGSPREPGEGSPANGPALAARRSPGSQCVRLTNARQDSFAVNRHGFGWHTPPPWQVISTVFPAASPHAGEAATAFRRTVSPSHAAVRTQAPPRRLSPS